MNPDPFGVTLTPRDTEAERPRETILVVDDYPFICQTLLLMLTGAGYHVLSANDGDQAQEIARRERKIDLLLTDIEMPAMRGDELARWFSSVHPETRIVFTSGCSDQIRAHGRVHFLPKPFRVEQLLRTVRAALDGPHPTAAIA